MIGSLNQWLGNKVWVKTSDNEYNASLSYVDDNRIIITSPFSHLEIPWIEVQLMSVFDSGKIIPLIMNDDKQAANQIKEPPTCMEGGESK